ncbi:hypothetical protein [uncultured Corynebacterium sp.]|uniref:hypothetical protein n=1 Tax=uncultured Corynebacterium sp. TaxID=159447 RepID=UPI0025CE7792|nr:hypothetical protein [uncultured Corynebacterium sp.]
MLTFDISALKGVHHKVQDAVIQVQNMCMFLGTGPSAFTTVPSINAAYAQHQTIWAGQSGSAVDTIENIRSRILWVHELFAAHISGFSLQEDLSKASLDNAHSHVTRDTSEQQLNLPSNAELNIQNLMYNMPIAAGEATTPLATLIQAFQGDDSIPLGAAKRWSDAGRQLGEAMANLNHASNMIAASAQGTSFDAARQAIGDLVKLGNVVSANTMTMATSVSQFPTIRAANLGALHAIQASTALIPEPAERLAAEQAAVASFVSSHLQPSLELVKPPVSNLGVPVTVRTGGGALNTGALGDASAPTIINAINGHSQAPTPIPAGTMADQAAQAATQAGHGNPSLVTTAPASAASSPVATPPSAPHLTPVSGASTVAPTPTSAPATPLNVVPPRLTAGSPVATPATPNSVSVRPASGAPYAPAGMGAGSPAIAGRNGTMGATNVTSISAPRGAVEPVPGASTGTTSGLGSPRIAGVAPIGGTAIGSAGGNTGAGRMNGTQRLPRLPFAAQSAAETNVVRGTFGSGQSAAGSPMGAGSRGAVGVGGRSTATGVGGGMAGGMGAGRGRGATVFSFSKADRDYFTRQFMGRKRKTVRKVITGQ